jgi:hypothetical protein
MGAKSFKFAIEQGVSVLQVFERCRALVRSVSLGWFFMGAKSFKFAMEEGFQYYKLSKGVGPSCVLYP